MTTPPVTEWREVRFRTAAELATAIEGKRVYETPFGYSDMIGGLRIFRVLDAEGRPTEEFAVYVADNLFAHL